MAYYRPADRVGGYPMGPELGPDGLVEIGALDRGVRPGGDYGYDVPSYGRRPLGGDYVGGPPGYYGGERPGRYRQGYAPSVYDEGFAPSVYDEGYLPPRQPPMLAEPSDLGMGLRDAGLVSGHADYGAGYGGPDFARYGGARGYGGGAMSAEDEVRRLRKELEHERREKHELELAAGGAIGYGLYERHEKKEAEDDGSSSSDDDDGKKEKRRHRFFHRH